MKAGRNNAAFGLIEVMVAIAFFAFALLPVITLFSSNMDSLNVIQARSQASLIAKELITHAVLVSTKELAPGNYDLSASEVESWPEFARSWKLCRIPPNFSRRLIVAGDEEPLGKRVTASIINNRISQANISMTRTVIPFQVKEN